MEEDLSPPFSTLSQCHFTAWTHGTFRPVLKGHWASSTQKGQHGCLRPALYMLQTIFTACRRVSCKLRVSCLLDIASFLWKLLPLSYFKSSSYTYPWLPCLLCKRSRTIADPGTGLWMVDGFLLSSPLPLLLPLSCNKQNYPEEKNLPTLRDTHYKGARAFSLTSDAGDIQDSFNQDTSLPLESRAKS